MTLTTPTTGFIFPQSATMISVDDAGEMHIADFWRNVHYYAQGIIAIDVLNLILEKKWSSKLKLLLFDHPVLPTLKRIINEPQLPLTGEHALAIGGYDTLFVELTGTCNERCVHCYAGSSPEIQQSLSRETVDAVLEDAAKIGFNRIQFTGGDPLICQFLPELVERVSKMEGTQCEIYTNGLLLTDRLLDKLEPFRPSFAFSYYSLDDEVHDSITQTPGSRKRTEAAIRRCLSRDLDVRAATIVMEQNAETAQATAKHLFDMGVKTASSSRSFEVGRGSMYEEHIEHESNEHQATTGSGAPSSHEVRAPQAKKRNPAGQGKLCIGYDSKVYPCIFNRDDALGDLAKSPLRDIILNPDIPERAEGDAEHCNKSLQCYGCKLTFHALRSCDG